MVSIDVSVGVGGKWTCGEFIVGQEENGRGLDAVSGDEDRPFKIGRGAGIVDRWNEKTFG